MNAAVADARGVGVGPGRTRLSLPHDYTTEATSGFVRKDVASSAELLTGGLLGDRPLAGECGYQPRVACIVAAYVLMPRALQVFLPLTRRDSCLAGLYLGKA